MISAAEREVLFDKMRDFYGIGFTECSEFYGLLAIATSAASSTDVALHDDRQIYVVGVSPGLHVAMMRRDVLWRAKNLEPGEQSLEELGQVALKLAIRMICGMLLWGKSFHTRFALQTVLTHRFGLLHIDGREDEVGKCCERLRSANIRTDTLFPLIPRPTREEREEMFWERMRVRVTEGGLFGSTQARIDAAEGWHREKHEE